MKVYMFGLEKCIAHLILRSSSCFHCGEAPNVCADHHHRVQQSQVGVHSLLEIHRCGRNRTWSQWQRHPLTGVWPLAIQWDSGLFVGSWPRIRTVWDSWRNWSSLWCISSEAEPGYPALWVRMATKETANCLRQKSSESGSDSEESEDDSLIPTRQHNAVHNRASSLPTRHYLAEPQDFDNKVNKKWHINLICVYLFSYVFPRRVSFKVIVHFPIYEL